MSFIYISYYADLKKNFFGKKWWIVHLKFKNFILNNYVFFCDFFQKKLDNIRSEEIVDGNIKIILELIWNIINQYQVYIKYLPQFHHSVDIWNQ